MEHHLLGHALATLREQGYPVRDAGAARLSVYQHAHLNVHGHYSFVLPDLAGGRRPLRNPDEAPPAWRADTVRPLNAYPGLPRVM